LDELTNSHLYIDVRDLYKDGLLKTGQTITLAWDDDSVVRLMEVQVDADAAWLSYQHRPPGGKWTPVRYRVALEWTACNYGGSRPWFRCPAEGCGRRVAILYGREIFACRQCHELTYQTQREPYWMRNILRAKKIRKTLGGDTGLLASYPPKPKGMHWRTYEKMCLEIEESEMRCWPGTTREPKKKGET